MAKKRKDITTNPKDFMRADLNKGVVVSLDLSKSMTGWAIHSGGRLIGYDAAPIKGDKVWHTYDNMRVRVSTILKVAHEMTKEVPSLLVVEDAMKQPGYASRIYECLYLAASGVAGRGLWKEGPGGAVPTAVVSATQVKAAVLGANNKRGTTKADIIKAITQMYPIGLDPEREHPDGDIADAIGVYVAASALGPVGRLRVGP